MKKNNLFAFVFSAAVIAFFTIACDFRMNDVGTQNWPTDKPVAPFMLRAANIDEGVRLDWHAPEGGAEIRGYEIYRWEGSRLGDIFGDTVVVGNITSWVDIAFNLIPGGTYVYEVRSFNGAGLSEETSNEIQIVVAPSPIQDLRAKALSSREIELNWTYADGAEYYYVYRSKSADTSSFARLDTIIYDNSFIDDDKGKGLEALTTYYYRVRASNLKDGHGGDAPLSNIASARTRLAAPAGIKVEILSDIDPARTKDSVKISWEAVEGAAGYQLLFETGSANATWDLIISSGTNLVYIDTRFVEFGLMSGTTLFYGARAIEKLTPTNADEIGDMAVGSAIKK